MDDTQPNTFTALQKHVNMFRLVLTGKEIFVLAELRLCHGCVPLPLPLFRSHIAHQILNLLISLQGSPILISRFPISPRPFGTEQYRFENNKICKPMADALSERQMGTSGQESESLLLPTFFFLTLFVLETTPFLLLFVPICNNTSSCVVATPLHHCEDGMACEQEASWFPGDLLHCNSPVLDLPSRLGKWT